MTIDEIYHILIKNIFPCVKIFQKKIKAATRKVKNEID